MNPSTGTFTSMDAYAGTIFDPVSLHKYLYANANPVMNRDPSGYFTITEEMSVCAVIGAYSNVTLTLIDIGLQGDNYEGDIGTDIGKSMLSGFISGFIFGALLPLFAGAGLTGGVIACSLVLIAVIMWVWGYACNAFAEELTPEGNFWDMNSTDQSIFLIGTAFEITGAVLTATLRSNFVASDLANFALDVLKLIFTQTCEEEKTNA